jgi:stage II sporulation protein R
MDGVFMSLKKMTLVSILILAAITVTVTALQGQQIRMAEKLIRLHVVANSDSDKDQWIKLKVRDAVLKVTEPLLENAERPQEYLQENLPLIQEAAVDCLRSLGCSDPVQVSFGVEEFPTRNYESFSLPAGIYQSLRVTIGAGQGHNWWCVVFPSICMRSASDMNAIAATAGLSDQEIDLITAKNGKYVLKFKLLELVQQLQKQLVLRK